MMNPGVAQLTTSDATPPWSTTEVYPDSGVGTSLGACINFFKPLRVELSLPSRSSRTPLLCFPSVWQRLLPLATVFPLAAVPASQVIPFFYLTSLPLPSLVMVCPFFAETRLRRFLRLVVVERISLFISAFFFFAELFTPHQHPPLDITHHARDSVTRTLLPRAFLFEKPVLPTFAAVLFFPPPIKA